MIHHNLSPYTSIQSSFKAGQLKEDYGPLPGGGFQKLNLATELDTIPQYVRHERGWYVLAADPNKGDVSDEIDLHARVSRTLLKQTAATLHEYLTIAPAYTKTELRQPIPTRWYQRQQWEYTPIWTPTAIDEVIPGQPLDNAVVVTYQAGGLLAAGPGMKFVAQDEAPFMCGNGKGLQAGNILVARWLMGSHPAAELLGQARDEGVQSIRDMAACTALAFLKEDISIRDTAQQPPYDIWAEENGGDAFMGASVQFGGSMAVRHYLIRTQ